MASRKISRGWTWLTSVLALIVFLDLCALTWYFWAAPEELATLQKILPIVGSWLVTILTFFGIRYKFRRGQSIEQVLRIRPVQLCVIASTILIWFFVLPFHSIAISVHDFHSKGPLSRVTVKVGHGNNSKAGISDEKGKFEIGGLRATSYKLQLEKRGYKTININISFLDVMGFRNVPVHLVKEKMYPLTVSSDPQGAEVYVDGMLKTMTLDKIQLSEGEHTIEVKKPRYKTPPPRRVKIPDDGDVITFTLEKDLVGTQP
jgi:hypothetical protein